MAHDTKFKSLVGKRFGRLKVLYYMPGKPRQAMCKCDCGKDKLALHDQLRKGKTNSCGCLQDEQRRKNGFASAKRRKVQDEDHQEPSPRWSIFSDWPVQRSL